MSRYVVGQEVRRIFDTYDEPLLISVSVDDEVRKFTGLFDHEENPIFRTPPPIGFGRDNEW